MIDPIFAELAAFLPGVIAEVRERQAALAGADPVRRGADRAAGGAVAPAGGRRRPRPGPLPHRPGAAPVLGAAQPRRRALHHPLRRGATPRFAIAATLHEAGHAMYEFNLPRDFAFRPGGMARGMTVHESQSLSLEKMAGRSQRVPRLAGAAAGRGIRRRSASALVARQRAATPGAGSTTASSASRPTSSPIRCT